MLGLVEYNIGWIKPHFVPCPLYGGTHDAASPRVDRILEIHRSVSGRCRSPDMQPSCFDNNNNDNILYYFFIVHVNTRAHTRDPYRTHRVGKRNPWHRCARSSIHNSII